jgi:hypothetical protein
MKILKLCDFLEVMDINSIKLAKENEQLFIKIHMVM